MTKVCNRYYDLIPWLRDARLSMTSSPEGEPPLAFAVLGTVEVDIGEADHVDRLGRLWEIVREHDWAEAMGFWFVGLASLVLHKKLDLEAEALMGRAVDRLHGQSTAWELGWALIWQSNVWSVFNLEENKLMEAENIFRRLGTPLEQGMTARYLGVIAMGKNRPVSEVEDYFQRATHFYRSLGNKFDNPTLYLAAYYLRHGKTEKAFAFFHDAQREHEQVGNLTGLADSLHHETINAVRYSHRDHAVAVGQRNIAMWKKLRIDQDHPANFAFSIYELGEAYRVFGETNKALETFERARLGFEITKLDQGLGYCHRSQGDMALKDERYLEALDHYKKYNEHFVRENHLWGLAQSHGKLALAHAYLGDLEAARAEMQASLVLVQTWSAFDLELIALLAEPVCLINEGKLEQAIELAALIANHPASWNETRWQAQEIMEWAAQDLPEEVVQKAIERGKELELDTVIKQLLGE